MRNFITWQILQTILGESGKIVTNVAGLRSSAGYYFSDQQNGTSAIAMAQIISTAERENSNYSLVWVHLTIYC